MRLAVVTKPGEVKVRDVATAAVGEEEVLIEVAACGLCTLERNLFAGVIPIYPVAPGHEVAGRVVAVGDVARVATGSPRVGDIVAADLQTRCGTCTPCRRGHSSSCAHEQGALLPDGIVAMGAGLADYVSVSAAQAWATGSALPHHAAMTEPLACVVHSVRNSRFQFGDRVAIIGAGYMGRLHLALVRHLGAAEVGVIDIAFERCQAAANAGATWVSHPDSVEPEALGAYDVVFVTAGDPTAIELAMSLSDLAGSVILYAAFRGDPPFTIYPNKMHRNEVSLVGVRNQEPEDWRTAAALISSGAISTELDDLVSARFVLDEVQRAFQIIAGEPTYRIVVEP